MLVRTATLRAPAGAVLAALVLALPAQGGGVPTHSRTPPRSSARSTASAPTGVRGARRGPAAPACGGSRTRATWSGAGTSRTSRPRARGSPAGCGQSGYITRARRVAGRRDASHGGARAAGDGGSDGDGVDAERVAPAHPARPLPRDRRRGRPPGIPLGSTRDHLRGRLRPPGGLSSACSPLARQPSRPRSPGWPCAGLRDSRSWRRPGEPRMQPEDMSPRNYPVRGKARNLTACVSIGAAPVTGPAWRWGTAS